MGDRGNIIVKDGDRGAVWMYSHWSGYQLPKILAEALKSPVGRKRWNDQPYLTRIIFEAMIEKHRGGETGFGISTGPTDNEHALLVVDPEALKVAIHAEAGDGDIGKKLEEWSFDGFVALDEKRLTELGELGRKGGGR